MKVIDIPYLQDSQFSYLRIFEKNNKYAFAYEKDGKISVSNNIGKLKELLDIENLPFIQLIDKNPINQKVYNFFNTNLPSAFTAEELKGIPKDFLKIAVNPEKIKKAQELINNIRFEYADKYYELKDDLEKDFIFDKNSNIEKGLADLFSIKGKFAFLIGVTGSGKTYTTQTFAKNNGYKIFESVVSFTGDVRESILGKKTLETDEKGKDRIKHIPGAGLLAFRNVVENKKESIVFIDEVFRGNATDVMTMFSLKNKEGESFYEIEGVENYHIAEIENVLGQKAIVLITQDRNVFFEKGKILKPLPEDSKYEDIERAVKNGNVTKVKTDDLEKYGYKILEVYGTIKEKFKIPESKLKIVLAGNFGEEYDISSQLDSAVLSRAGIVLADNYEMDVEDLLRMVEGKQKKLPTKMIKLTKEEETQKKDFIVEFFKSLRTGISLKDVKLPKRAYSARNMKTLLDINKRPEDLNIKEYMGELINKYFVINYTSWDIGEENIEISQKQKNFIKEAVENAKESTNISIDEEFDFEKDIGEKVTQKTGKKPKLRL